LGFCISFPTIAVKVSAVAKVLAVPARPVTAQPRFAEKRVKCIGPRMSSNRAHAGNRQMGKASRHGRGETPELLTLAFIEAPKLGAQRPVGFVRGNLLKRSAQVGKFTSDRPRCQIVAEESEAVVDGGTHRGKPHQLG